jgi:hypothetical protein
LEALVRKLLAFVAVLALSGNVVAAQELGPRVTVRSRARQVLICRATPVEASAVYIHTWARKYVADVGGVPQFQTWHISDGPYEAGPAVDDLVRQIGREGLYAGSMFFPAHKVLLVELRTN